MKSEYSLDTPATDRSLSDDSSGFERRQALSNASAILVVEDQPYVARAIAITLESAGFSVDRASHPDEAYSLLARKRFAGMLLDLNFAQGRTGGEEGFACLSRILEIDPLLPVLVITAHSGIQVAIAAIKAGAKDFITKPWRNADLVDRLRAALREAHQIAPRPDDPREARAYGIARLIGASASIELARALVRRIGPLNASVLIEGPAGSGRTLTAHALHETSPRVEKELLIVDCRDVIDWTSLECAGGTLVLRHADQLDQQAQERLLSRLPRGARLIGIVTDKSLLIWSLRVRLGAIDIALSPLAHRGEDAFLLACHFARIAAERHGRNSPQFTPSAKAMILETAWPEEIRGLAHAVERAVLLGEDGTIDATSLAIPSSDPESPPPKPLSTFSLSRSEKAIIQAALEQNRHSVTHTAAALGLSRAALYRRMSKYGL